MTEQAVLLHIYDLRFTFAMKEMSLAGAFHTGIEAFSREWSFGYPAGVYSTVPLLEPRHLYRCSVPLGTTLLSRQETNTALQDLNSEWPGAEYDSLGKNCNGFC